MAEAVTDEAVAVNIQAIRLARAECEARILAALNDCERATGLQALKVELAGQRTDGDRVTTRECSVELVLR